MLDLWPATGDIYLVRGVATEEVGSEFTATITAMDGGNPRLSSTARVVVRVLNCTSDDFRSHHVGHGVLALVTLFPVPAGLSFLCMRLRSAKMLEEMGLL